MSFRLLKRQESSLAEVFKIAAGNKAAGELKEKIREQREQILLLL
jgi:predicted CopG family antitoxin